MESGAKGSAMPGESGRYGVVRVFRAEEFPAKLRIPPGMPYVEPVNKGDILPALQEGLAVFERSGDCRAFIWKSGTQCLADYFCSGPPTHQQFATVEEAAAFAARLCP